MAMMQNSLRLFIHLEDVRDTDEIHSRRIPAPPSRSCRIDKAAVSTKTPPSSLRSVLTYRVILAASAHSILGMTQLRACRAASQVKIGGCTHIPYLVPFFSINRYNGLSHSHHVCQLIFIRLSFMSESMPCLALSSSGIKRKDLEL